MGSKTTSKTARNFNDVITTIDRFQGTPDNDSPSVELHFWRKPGIFGDYMRDEIDLTDIEFRMPMSLNVQRASVLRSDTSSCQPTCRTILSLRFTAWCLRARSSSSVTRVISTMPSRNALLFASGSLRHTPKEPHSGLVPQAKISRLTFGTSIGPAWMPIPRFQCGGTL